MKFSLTLTSSNLLLSCLFLYVFVGYASTLPLAESDSPDLQQDLILDDEGGSDPLYSSQVLKEVVEEESTGEWLAVLEEEYKGVREGHHNNRRKRQTKISGGFNSENLIGG